MAVYDNMNLQSLKSQFGAGLWARFSIIRFFWSSCAAYTVDLGGYLILSRFLLPELANLISYSLGIVVNFLLHRTIVFQNINRTVAPSFVISIILSLIGLSISTGIIYLLRTYVLQDNLTPKLIATAIVFFWNYFSKKHIAFLVSSD